MPSLPFGAGADRLAIGDARPTQLGRDAELPLQLRQRDLEMALAEAGDERLVRLGVPVRLEARILVVQAVESRLQLLLVGAVDRRDRHLDERLGEGDLRQPHRMRARGERVVRVRVAQLGDAADVAGVEPRHLDAIAALRDREMVQLLGAGRASR